VTNSPRNCDASLSIAAPTTTRSEPSVVMNRRSAILSSASSSPGSLELLRDRFWPVASPQLLASGKPVRRPRDLAQFPFIHAAWPAANKQAPTWRRWLTMAQKADPDSAVEMAARGLSFS